jgi:LysM repeat protein
VAEGEGTMSEESPPVERASGPFRSGPDTDADRPQSICRFLALKLADGTFDDAVRLDTANRCVAIGEPLAQSGRQQELLCLAAAHVNCPRYLRGILLAGSPEPPPKREPISPAVIGAAFVLAAAIATSFGFLAVRGGFNIAIPTPSPALVAVVASPVPSASPTIAPTATPTEVASASPSPSLIPEPSPSPIPTPTASPVPTPTPPPATPKPTPAATSDRFAVLTKCPSTPNCWIYVIRSGDNLNSIANWFGVSYDRMIAMNPGLRTPIHAGDKLRIPTPTR